MENSQPGQLFSPMPILHFAPYHLLSNKLDKFYEIPIYKTILRIGTMSTTGQSTNFVISVVLPYTQTPDYWIMQGAAIFCSLPD
jgi:dynein heavy chain